MCGIAGLWLDNPIPAERLRSAVEDMRDALIHRGPDDAGHWLDVEAGVGLGHRRLAIVDLSKAGHQPMASASGRYQIVYNGEIYNCPELRQQLADAGHPVKLRGHSDTEVLLAAIEAWGLESALQRSVGMFALGLWDSQRRRLSLARDRLGIKPLYVARLKGGFAFASELAGLRGAPGFTGELNPQALGQLLSRDCIAAPLSIYKQVHKLEPSTIASYDSATGSASTTEYWSARDVAQRGQASPLDLSDEEAVDALDAALRQAIGDRMVADVPLGAFLSGGIDSSTVAALMQAQSTQPIRSFSIGFVEQEFNEAEDAKRIAKHLGTEHTEFYVKADDALECVGQLSRFYDEPFADSSQLPTYLLCRMTRQEVTVALSGDGGDELFAGYNRHSWGPRLYQRGRQIPRGLRAALSHGIQSVRPQYWDRVRKLLSVLPSVAEQRQFGDKLHKLARVLPFSDAADLYRRLTERWHEPSRLLAAGIEPDRPASDSVAFESLSHSMMLQDLLGYLPNDILTKVDRASMAVSLEARVPLLDHRVVELAWQLPMHMKLRGGTTKWLLRQVLDRYVPRALMERPKAGFAVPIGPWLRGPLRPWAEELLSSASLAASELLNVEAIRELWREHLERRRNWEHELWSVLMFQAWYRDQHCGGV